MAKTSELVPVCAHCGKPIAIRLVPREQAERPAEETRG